jgi:hypothetical protein
MESQVGCQRAHAAGHGETLCGLTGKLNGIGHGCHWVFRVSGCWQGVSP